MYELWAKLPVNVFNNMFICIGSILHPQVVRGIPKKHPTVDNITMIHTTEYQTCCITKIDTSNSVITGEWYI